MKQIAMLSVATIFLAFVGVVAVDTSDRHHHRLRRRTAAAVRQRDVSETPVVAPPLGDMYAGADGVTRYLENGKSNLYFEGARPDVDVPSGDERDLKNIFEETPDIFKSCVLVREFATPLRVGSALTANKQHLLKTGGSKDEVNEDSGDDSSDGDDGEQDSDDDDDDDVGTGTRDEGPPGPPGDELMMKGGVADIPDGGSAQAIMQVNMIAYLSSITGPVSVVPKGVVAKWTSKRKVPIAGYLCTNTGSPVLHTLPTPCVPTSLNDEGEESGPPPPELAKTAPKQESIAVTGGAPAPAQMEPPGISGTEPASIATKVPTTIAGAPSPAMANMDSAAETVPISAGVAPSPAAAFLELGSVASKKKKAHRALNGTFAVYVGSSKLHFTSQGRAEKFCHRLAEKIAEDPGDNEWDTDKLKGLAIGPDVKVGTFVQLTRKFKPAAWTTGTKSLLVLVMDWMAGDVSKAPLSSQTLTPKHYEERIFPRVKEAFRSMSLGQFALDVTVVPEVIRYTKSRNKMVMKGYPFPGLYNGATQALKGNARWSSKYNPEDYDLVYVISPQQAPTGTKGVAWVGAKGAMCNGCEEISENFQTMVAVHELGHNLGLSHAGSESLEYGNPFDWMGNYPDVPGLSFGLGYKQKLHWIQDKYVAKITDKSLSEDLNEEYILRPFDTEEAWTDQIAGVQLSLKSNGKNDLYFSYRKTPGKEAGVFVVKQDKQSPNSELIDMACHTPSQKDAKLQSGWTYVDPSSQVVVTVKSVDENSATLHFFKAPGSEDLKAIRARDTYTDGQYKCPRTCTDSDLLVANFNGCRALAQKDYCDTGAITMGGKKYTVKTDLCPNACGECANVLSGSTMKSVGACQDRDIKISGMNCPTVAAKGHCEANTNLGNVGQDLCPKSCGNCGARPSFDTATSRSYSDPKPRRSVREASQLSHTGPLTQQPTGGTAATQGCVDDSGWQDDQGDGCSQYRQFIYEGKLSRSHACRGEVEKSCRATCTGCSNSGGAGAASSCEDDPSWQDKDGDSCKTYDEYIQNGKMTQEGACTYDGGVASRYCRKTCNSCMQSITDNSGECTDQMCVTQWLKQTGQCFKCEEWPARCNETHFQQDCPLTCGLCPVSAQIADDSAKKEVVTDCEDSQCIEHWRNGPAGKCYKCSDFASDYCGNDREFMEACPKSCKLCDARVSASTCVDDFAKMGCNEYKSMGWCSQKTISRHCKRTCGKCDEDKKPYLEDPEPPTKQPKPKKLKGIAGRTGPSAAVVVLAGLSVMLRFIW